MTDEPRPEILWRELALAMTREYDDVRKERDDALERLHKINAGSCDKCADFRATLEKEKQARIYYQALYMNFATGWTAC